MKKIVISGIVSFILCGCGANLQMIKDQAMSRIDPISVSDGVKLESDLTECATYAQAEVQRMRSEMVGKIFLGAILGAGLGYSLGSMYNRDVANKSLAYGAVAGAGGGAAATQNHYDVIVGNCLRNRGYELLW